MFLYPSSIVTLCAIFISYICFSTEMMEEKEVEGRKNIEKNNLVIKWQELCSNVDEVTPTPQV